MGNDIGYLNIKEDLMSQLYYIAKHYGEKYNERKPHGLGIKALTDFVVRHEAQYGMIPRDQALKEYATRPKRKRTTN